MAAQPIPQSVASTPGSSSDGTAGDLGRDRDAEPAAERAAPPLEPLRRRLREHSALEQLGPLFAGPAAPPHGEHHSPYR